MIVAATGHRPDKLGGYDTFNESRLTALALQVLRERAPAGVITGMAQGWDTAIALAAIKARIPFTAAVPFAGQEKVWPQAAQERYQRLLQKAAKVEVICPGSYDPRKLIFRNHWMVERCDFIVALWDGTPGGTRACIRYAAKIQRPYENYWRRWYEGNQGHGSSVVGEEAVAGTARRQGS